MTAAAAGVGDDGAMAKSEGESAGAGDVRARREQRRQEHLELSRTHLLDAAEEVFGRKGFHETTLKEIAEQAGFAVGSVYSFFENKDDLFRQIYVRRGAEFMVGLRAALGSDAPALEQLHALVDHQVGFFRTHPRFARLYLRTSSATMPTQESAVDQAVAANYDESMALQADLFRRGQADGTFRAGDPEVLARLFSGIVSAFQATDPAVLTDDDTSERLPLADLHAIIEAAFRA